LQLMVAKTIAVAVHGFPLAAFNGATGVELVRPDQSISFGLNDQSFSVFITGTTFAKKFICNPASGFFLVDALALNPTDSLATCKTFSVAL